MKLYISCEQDNGRLRALFITLMLLALFGTTGRCKFIAETSTGGDDTKCPVINKVFFTDEIYERLVYFSKVSAMASCISDNSLIPGRTLKNGGCPSHLRFCSDDTVNPTNSRTRVELVLTAGRGELGTGTVLVDHGKEIVMMAFRGSTTGQDWASDFEIYPVDYFPTSHECYEKMIADGDIEPCENCKIHRGFNKFSNTLGASFLENVESIFMRYPDYRLIITGHSLGAALAIISGIEFKLRGFDPVVLTYANPKMFNREMKEWVDQLFSTTRIDAAIKQRGEISFREGYFRVVHDQDYIPMVPPFYHAAGLEIFIKKDDLPHEICDLEYKGSREYYDPEQFDGENWQLKASGLNDGDWIHKKEHRSYFVNIGGCGGF